MNPGPVPASTVALVLRWLREAQTYLEDAPGWPTKRDARDCLDESQRLLGTSDERGRRADGSRPSDERTA